ncbi:GAF and ANTAR domain-containing protein [uncultured Arthrobacter sp.]|uniref:GAF and ANTAR domain-containing protein n=1 Tax=uncultured Arthrobacter sp. TaxID=114050 RepID=UPI00261F5F40|nr:GAF and ANTAR domain-containing protein [uncultured Arthrobacter sp.]
MVLDPPTGPVVMDSEAVMGAGPVTADLVPEAGAGIAELVVGGGPGGVAARVGVGVELAGQVQDLVLESGPLHVFLGSLAELIADRLSTPEREVLCGVTLLRPGVKTTVASSSDRARALDEVQYAFDDGPCMDAARHKRINHVLDAEAEGQRWPEYRAVIASHGLHSLLAVPVGLGIDEEGRTGCAINLYCDTAWSFTVADIRDAKSLAAEISRTVRIAVRIAHLDETTSELKGALGSGTLINLATGIIMSQNRCSVEAATAILEAASSARTIPVADLARTIIDSVTAEPVTTHFSDPRSSQPGHR